MHEAMKTSEIPFFESIHGQERRLQRKILVKDLQAAVKYGKKEKSSPQRQTREPRWKFTYNDIVYITDETGTKEVTSWALNPPSLHEVLICPMLEDQYVEAKRRLAENPAIITSHTLLVVDQSGSMRKADLMGHRSRSDGVYFAIAEECIAPRLYPPSAGRLGGNGVTFTDVVTLIEMRETATVVFEFEPISWVLYNKVVDLWKSKQSRGHGFYQPALNLAFSLLDSQVTDKCALTMFFLSDGRPSDTPKTVNLMGCMVNAACLKYGDRLNFFAMGFGPPDSDFAVLRDLVDRALASGASTAQFFSALDSCMLGSAISSVVNSSSCLRSNLSRLTYAVKDRSRIRADVEREAHNATTASINPFEWEVYDLAGRGGFELKRLVWTYYYDLRKDRWRGDFNRVGSLQSAHATGFAVKKKCFGEGAERLVCQMTEIGADGRPVGISLVAKSSLYVLHEDCDEVEFHKVFMRTQHKAASLAKNFNRRLDELHISPLVPRIEFLPCAVYHVQSHASSDRAYLCERWLDPSRYMKWNDNAGNVDGIKITNRVVEAVPLGPGLAIDEGDEDEEDEEDDDNDCEAGSIPVKGVQAMKSPQVLELEASILESDIPQAFSHFSYMWTKRQRLVCDLQGVLNLSSEKPLFELTDPCIHYNMGSWNNKNYGRTDKGRDGIQAFLATHQCNPVCRLLRLLQSEPPVSLKRKRDEITF